MHFFSLKSPAVTKLKNFLKLLRAVVRAEHLFYNLQVKVLSNKPFYFQKLIELPFFFLHLLCILSLQ